ncbi:Rha family transcriptional regulator [Erwinia typographi]|uniref:hypothetical protein n=1 Tax=Erwinia typographi TaxID=371042 RepID=UPI00068EEB36|nr:hypothetical protein [Erwinia typographi]
MSNVSTEILVQHRKEARIDSRVISQRAGIQHESLMATIKRHQKELEVMGDLPRNTCGIGLGRPRVNYLLNEAQFDYIHRIIRGRDAEAMKKLKVDVTKALLEVRS